eukprot:TRINITY_DN304_c0_g1_i2.p1 TRINITY_DN304_c0_g1~~TRINITY_DN304_c0_g1_i2.p1  ORF type:complete len:373 (+),score=148.16 TRINITY_DN304_c0_g1_i2:24-1121(+)
MNFCKRKNFQSASFAHRRSKSHSVAVSSEEKGIFGFLHRPQNIRFYKGKRESKPDGDYIDIIHRNWFYRYVLLEDNVGYIEWLFPTPTTSANNPHSYSLRTDEASKMANDLEVAIRYVLSYRLMLNFYGIVLVNDQTGEVARHPEIWAARYGNLNTSPHNFTRITRMLTSLCHLGFGKRYVGPLVEHFRTEIVDNKLLPNCQKSLDEFWTPTQKEAESETYENFESVFFSETSSQEYIQYSSDIARGKYWFGKASDVQLNEFTESLKEANAHQVKFCDEKKMVKKDVEGVSTSGSNASYFKQHYNTEQEKDEATDGFFKKVQEEKEKIAEGRRKAEATLRALVEAKKAGAATSPPASDFVQSSIL